MQVAEVVVRILEDEGITDIFGIPGASINPVYKYLGESDKIKHYTVRHEEAAVHAETGISGQWKDGGCYLYFRSRCNQFCNRNVYCSYRLYTIDCNYGAERIIAFRQRCFSMR